MYVAYTGTHDNDTSLGWLMSLDEHGKQMIQKHIDITRKDLPWPMIRAVMESRACIAIIPLQDVLMLDSAHRMNTPGTTEGNWQWGFDWSMLTPILCAKLLHVTRHSGRCAVTHGQGQDSISCSEDERSDPAHTANFEFMRE